MRSSGRGGAKKAEEAQACLDAIAAMPDDDRALAERVHTLVNEAAPDLRPKTWYGMPAYVDQEGKVVCFFKPAVEVRRALRDAGIQRRGPTRRREMWPTSMR